DLTRGDCAAYHANPNGYRSGDVHFTIDKRVYGASVVKDSLLEAQNNKCAYCEATFRDTSFGAVEHYRPKKFAQQGPGEEKEYPGYYWLAYDWHNLLVSCEVCNTTHKQNYFPLANPTERARSHLEDVSKERPLLIHPAIQDPREHIRFRNEAPEALDEIG